MSNTGYIESADQVQSETASAAKIYTLGAQSASTDRASTSGSWNAGQSGGEAGTLWQYANAPVRNCMSASDFWSALSDATYRMNGLDADSDSGNY